MEKFPGLFLVDTNGASPSQLINKFSSVINNYVKHSQTSLSYDQYLDCALPSAQYSIAPINNTFRLTLRTMSVSYGIKIRYSQIYETWALQRGPVLSQTSGLPISIRSLTSNWHIMRPIVLWEIAIPSECLKGANTPEPGHTRLCRQNMFRISYVFI